MSQRDQTERCLEALYDGQIEAERAAREARLRFLTEAAAATDETLPSADRVRVAALAKRIGLPRGTLLARLEAYRKARDEHRSTSD